MGLIRSQPWTGCRKTTSEAADLVFTRTACRNDANKAYSVFSSNSGCQVLSLQLGLDELPTFVFSKHSRRAFFERLGAELAMQYYPRVQKPSALSSNRLAYPMFNGQMQAELRYHWLKGGCHKDASLALIMDAELKKAEDVLRAYAMSVGKPRVLSQPQSLSIHRFFHERLATPGTRLREFYKDGLVICDKPIGFEKFFNTPLDINSQRYPSLNSICKRPEHLLHPAGELNDLPVAFGLGDAHGGNMMIARNGSAQGYHDILYIDYEVAGFHAIVLDLAKPFYNDVFFSTLYSDTIENNDRDVRYHMSDDILHVSLALDIDRVSKDILEIKIRHLIEPLRKFLKARNLSIDSSVPHFAHALSACALLTRTYRHNLRTLMQAVAIGVLLSQATSWKELWERCDSLLSTLRSV